MEIFVFGCGGHAKVVSEVIEAAGQWRIAAYITADPQGERFLGRDVLAEGHFLETHRDVAVALAVGDNRRRQSLYERARERCSFPAIVHPAATLSPTCLIGAGTVVMPGAVINAAATVGRFCVVNSGAVVEHDCRLADFVSVSPRACICGACRLEEGCFVGAGATVIQGLTIGPWSLVGAGAAVCGEVEAHSLVLGVPARHSRRL